MATHRGLPTHVVEIHYQSGSVVNDTINLTITTHKNLTAYNIACPTVSHGRPTDGQTPLAESLRGKVDGDDDSVVLSSDQLQRATQFRIVAIEVKVDRGGSRSKS